jgi:polyphosphate kinase
VPGGPVALSTLPELRTETLVPARASTRFLNRELSWLDFDRRVHELAADAALPLLDRVKLCSIVARNLDEFFAVRVAELVRQVAAGIERRDPDGRTRAQTLHEIRARVEELDAAQCALWRDELQPGLAAEGIPIVGVERCSARERRTLARRFEREVQPLLTPIAVGRTAPFPFPPSRELNVAVLTRDGRGRPRFVRINVPGDLPRFVEVGESGTRVLLEDAIVHFVPTIAGTAIFDHAVFRVTRDAELILANDGEPLIDEIEEQLSRRPFGDVVRLEIAEPAPAGVRRLLERELATGGAPVYARPGPLGFAALAEIAAIERPDLKSAPWRPVTRRPFAAGSPADLVREIRRRDVLVHHPYDSFEATVEAFLAAARDPKVAALKATLYRTGNPSATLDSLVRAAAEGKQAVCLVELRARFDEQRNIEWSRALERGHVSVFFGARDMKAHAKLALLVRRERGGLRRYVHIGTGNYHASNASIYEDLSLFTADEDVAADVAELFNAVAARRQPGVFRKLLVAPWSLREGVLGEIRRVTRAAEAAEKAAIRIKVNSLADPQLVEALYAAGSAGVRVDVVTRGICVLRPGAPGLSERISVRSVLGRFLEHSRILTFRAGDRVTAWIGSADLMPRNLDRRVEVFVPVEDSRLRAELSSVLDALMADTRFAWELGADGVWRRCRPGPGEKTVSAQEWLMERAVKRAKKRPVRGRS